MPLIIGGYFLTDQQLATLGAKRGLNIPNGEAHILNRHFRSRGINSLTAVPVALRHRDRDSTGAYIIGTLLQTQNRYEGLTSLRDCKPFEPTEQDREIEAWLRRCGVDPVWETVPDPYGKSNLWAPTS